jgi:proteasome assembly chaperone (PAC2) family protein
MNFSKSEKATSDLLKYSWQPEFTDPAIIMGWRADVASLASRVTDYLVRKLSGRSFAEIEPVDFFPLNGVLIEDDLVQFPESKFYSCPGNDLIIFKSESPVMEWYDFIKVVLDVAEKYRVKEFYILGGMVSLNAHTAPRQLTGSFNSLELKENLRDYNLFDVNYETPLGQRPSVNSYFLWEAKKRGLSGASLWVPIPFYLAAVSDFEAEKRVLEFFDRRFDLGLDIDELEESASTQNQRLAEIRGDFPDINDSINQLESNISLTDEENQKLIQEIARLLPLKSR